MLSDQLKHTHWNGALSVSLSRSLWLPTYNEGYPSIH